jgi:hypothetical protein
MILDVTRYGNVLVLLLVILSFRITRDLSFEEENSSTLTIDGCHSACFAKEYMHHCKFFLNIFICCKRYSGRRQCFCGNSYGMVGVASDCNTECMGDTTEYVVAGNLIPQLIIA